MLIPLLLTALAVAPGPIPDGSDQDSVMATAPSTTPILEGAADPTAPPVGAARTAPPHGLNTDQQIAQWLAARSPSTSEIPGDSPVWRDDREPHGEVSVGFGTGGYRDYAAAVSLPVGESGRLDISVRQSENAYPYGYGYGGGYGYEPYFADSGYAFPGQAAPGAALEYERRIARPGGPPWARPVPRAQQPAEE